MKKVLIITYYWPPSGGAAVQRWLSFANKLSQKGWQVYLLTVDENYATYQLRDESLREQIDLNIQVYTTKTKEPFKLFTAFFGKKSIPKPAFSNESNPSFLKKVFRFIRGNFFIPDPRKGWKNFAVAKAIELIDSENIDRVITAGPPHSTHFVGKELKERKNIFWLADFHDLWTDVIYYNQLYHLPFVKRKDAQLERLILESADLIATVGDKYKQKLLGKSNKLKENDIEILRIGYEESLFENDENNQQSEFVITYTGSIADFYSPGVFIYALKNIRGKYSSLPVKLRFVGVLSEGIKREIANAGLADILEVIGYVPHKQSIEYLRKSTLLLLVNPVTRDEEMVIPGKIYEYLAAQKPIINITKLTAETAQLIEQANAGKTFDRQMQTELEYYLEELIERWKVFKTLDLSNKENVFKYSRSEISDHLVNLLERKS